MEGQFQVALEGGSPWGFTLQGGVDFRSPLRVGKVSLKIYPASGDPACAFDKVILVKSYMQMQLSY